MGIIDIDFGRFQDFLFIFSRIAALYIFIPVMGSPLIPSRLKIGLIFATSLLIMPLLKGLPLPQPNNLFELSMYLIFEAMVGWTIAYTARLIFSAVQIAGTVVDFQMGFGVVNVIDPQTNSQVSVTAQFQNILAILLFFATDAHHLMIQAIIDSFFLINPTELSLHDSTVEFILLLFTGTFVTATKIAAPVMAILFFLSVGLGLVARTVPQMNVFIVGFPLQIGVGLLMIGLSMNFFGTLVANEFHDLPGKLIGMMRTF